MPTNSNYDKYFKGIGEVPTFTYGMITITSIVLAYMTYMDPYIPEEVEEAKEPILEATSIDGVVDSNPLENNGVVPEEIMPQEEPPLSQEGEPPQEEEQQLPPQEEQPPQEEEQQQQPPPVAGGKRRKRSTRKSRLSEKKHSPDSHPPLQQYHRV